MVSRTTRIAAIVVAVALAAGGAWMLRQRGAPSATPGTSATAAPGGTRAVAPSAPTESVIEFSATDLATVQMGDISRTIPLTGTLKPINQTLVRAKVPGELKALPVREGMTVSAGQMLARIEAIEFDARVKEREAVERSAQAQVDQARRTLDNNRALLAKNFISQSAFDTAQSGYDVALANRDAAIAQLAQAQKALTDTLVTAPMAGIIFERFAQVGEKVSPDSKIVSIVDLSRMEIEAPVPSSEVGSVRVGQSIVLRIEGVDREQTGQVMRISPSTSAGTRSVPVYIGLVNRDPRIRAGLFAQGTLAVATRSGVLLAPSAALRESGGRTFVYAIDGERLAQRDVRTGLRDDAARAPGGGIGVIEITAGLKAGDRIVAANLGTLRAGSRVRESAGNTPARQ